VDPIDAECRRRERLHERVRSPPAEDDREDDWASARGPIDRRREAQRVATDMERAAADHGLELRGPRAPLADHVFEVTGRDRLVLDHDLEVADHELLFAH
jgi:hypothetical protein